MPVVSCQRHNMFRARGGGSAWTQDGSGGRSGGREVGRERTRVRRARVDMSVGDRQQRAAGLSDTPPSLLLSVLLPVLLLLLLLP